MMKKYLEAREFTKKMEHALNTKGKEYLCDPEVMKSINAEVGYEVMDDIVEHDFYIELIDMCYDGVEVWYLTCKYSGESTKIEFSIERVLNWMISEETYE